MNKFLDIITPRFMSAYTAMQLTGDGESIEPVCDMDDVQDGERFDYVCKVRFFNLFGMAVFPRFIGEPIAWDDYMKGERP